MTTDPRQFDDPTREEATQLLIDASIARMHTVGPAEVLEDWNQGQQCVKVRVLVYGRRVNLETGEIEIVEQRPIAKVPILFARGGGRWGIVGPIRKGDRGIVLHAERSTADFRETGEPGAPSSLRRFNLSDAYFLPTGVDFVNVVGASNLHADDLVIFYDNEIRIGSAEATEYAARADRVAARVKRLEDAFAAHTHGVSTTVTGTCDPVAGTIAGTGTATTAVPGNAGDVAPRTTADDVKSDTVRLE